MVSQRILGMEHPIYQGVRSERFGYLKVGDCAMQQRQAMAT
jgi:hypothetical protein